MKFCSLSSGSKGNCQYIETKYMKILVDAGLSGVKIERLLQSIGVHPGDIDYILVTHEHLDHIQGVGILSRRYDIPIVANYGTWMAMESSLGKIKEEHKCVFETGKFSSLGDLDFFPFLVHHDAQEPVGFAFYQGNKKAVILTDTGMVTAKMKKIIEKADIYLMEANHDVDLLMHGSYPVSLKERILSDLGHLSNESSGNVLAEVVKGEGEIVFLGHLSDENNIPKLALRTVGKILQSRGLIMAKDLRMTCAMALKASPCIELG